jgi:Cu/Ag efflux pump CusA
LAQFAVSFLVLADPEWLAKREAIMIGIVKLALRRPYTFIVMAMLIMIFGVGSALRTPIDIFPNINIPVISVVFSYTGLPPDDMAGRVVTFYERSLTTSVNDIEHHCCPAILLMARGK